jgi:hypothetical protein
MKSADPQNTHVIALPLSKIVPDRYQARLALPPDLKAQFFSGEIDCYAAARELLAAAEDDPGLFRLVNDLRLLGQSILNERQIEPATGVWVDTDGELVFVLETGERRFWSLALEAVARQMPEEPLLKVSVEPGASRQRQVAENFLREDLCAVEMGKAVATMILESQDVYPEDNEDEMSYYRRALQVNRLPSGTWPEIERITGFSRPVLYRHLRLLALDDELLYQATLYRLPEGALREIVLQPKEHQREMVQRAIQERWGQVLEGMQPGLEDPKDQGKPRGAPSDTDARHKLARRITSVLGPLSKQGESDGNFDQVAKELSALLDHKDNLAAVGDTFAALAESIRKLPNRKNP